MEEQDFISTKNDGAYCKDNLLNKSKNSNNQCCKVK